MMPNVPKADLGVAIEFSHAGAFIFQAPEIFDPHIEEILELQDQLRQAYAERRWQLEWVVVTRVLEATSATILVSESSQSKVEFSAKGELGHLGPTDLGNAEVGLSMRAQSGTIVRVVGAPKVTPLFQLAKLVTPWSWGSPRLDYPLSRRTLFLSSQEVQENPRNARFLHLQPIEPPGI